MMLKTSWQRAAAWSLLVLLGACASPRAERDYTAFRNSKPQSILVLPPVNETTDVNATSGLLAQMTMPLAEAGYYVMPVAETSETFRQNGVGAPEEIEAVSPAKMREIFGADTALYSKVTQYGTVYRVIDSDTVVTASAKLVDLRTGDVLWAGAGSASGKELRSASVEMGGLIGMLVQAAVRQVTDSLTDRSYDVAGLASQRMLAVGHPNGLLYGPRSPKYGTD
jgi:hypothetical protein